MGWAENPLPHNLYKPPVDSDEGSTGEQPEIPVIDWKTAAQHVGDLHPGDMVTGFTNVEELDIFANNVGRYLNGHAPTLDLPNKTLTSSGRRTYIGWHDSSMPPSQGIMPKRFLGRLENLAVLLLDDKLSSLGAPRKRFVITADTRSTGKPSGKIATECSIGIHNRHKYLTTALYKKLPAHSADTVAETIFKNSQETAEAVIRSNLRHIFSAGLPGQGKRS